MAEVVGLIASVATLLSVASTAVRVSKSLFRLASEAGPIEAEIYQFASQIRSFAVISSLAHESLYSNCARESQSQVLDYMNTHRVLDQLSEDSKQVKERILQVKPQIRSLLSKLGIVTRIKWVIMKSNILGLGPDMESIKTSLLLVINIVKLELAVGQKSSDEAPKEIKRLKHQIGVLLDTVELLQKGYPQLYLGLTNRISRSNHSFSSGYHNEHSALFELAESMISHEKIPLQINPVVSSSSLLADEDQNINRAARECPVSVVRRDNLSSSFPTIAQNSGEKTREGSVESLPIKPILPEQSQRIVPKTRISHDSSESSVSNSHSRNNNNLLNVRPRGYLMNLNPSHKCESVNGCIITPTGPVSATALIDHDFEGNLISQAYATQLQLQVDLLEPEDAVWIDFGDNQLEKSVGRVVLEWNKGRNSHQASLRIHCSVSEHNIRPLIFGRPFINKRRQYWSINTANF